MGLLEVNKGLFVLRNRVIVAGRKCRDSLGKNLEVMVTALQDFGQRFTVGIVSSCGVSKLYISSQQRLAMLPSILS